MNNVNIVNILICPVCRRKFNIESTLAPAAADNSATWSCPEHHSFDRAGAGYLNLLPPSGSRTHGDNKQMIEARRALLDSGLYAPLRDRLTSLLTERMDDHAIIWDSGCGEGYYTAQIAEIGAAHDWIVYCSDLSKDALKSAARRSKRLIPIAASSYSLPARSASCDSLLCLFAPQASDEFHRVLKPGGLMIQAIPGERHLFGLKKAIYDTPYENEVDRLPPKGFQTIDCIEIERTVTLTSKTQITSLFRMTPYAYRTSVSDAKKIESLSELTTPLHFYIFVYQKLPTDAIG